MPYFKPCPECGALLDPGELCDDCQNKKIKEAEKDEVFEKQESTKAS